MSLRRVAPGSSQPGPGPQLQGQGSPIPGEGGGRGTSYERLSKSLKEVVTHTQDPCDPRVQGPRPSSVLTWARKTPLLGLCCWEAVGGGGGAGPRSPGPGIPPATRITTPGTHWPGSGAHGEGQRPQHGRRPAFHGEGGSSLDTGR